MCLRVSSVRSTNRFNWEGDVILRDNKVRARRSNPATRRRYTTDIREFLSTAANAVVLDALDRVVGELSCHDQLLFRSRGPGAFDLRARALTAYLARSVAHASRDRAADAWLFPDETLDAGRGDCEDLAFLLGAMLLASGVSGYMVRVALGAVSQVGVSEPHSHAWVMYRDESGRWLLLDPLLFTQNLEQGGAKPSRRSRTARYEYQPRFVFNDQHLWAMKPARGVEPLDAYTKDRTFWEDFDPTFAAGIHDQIYDRALVGMSWARRNWVKSVSLAIDGDTFAYDPSDHFDNGYIAAGWQRVRERLATGNLSDFALATHAIADFYAHSSHAHFAVAPDGTVATVDEELAGEGPPDDMGSPPDYGAAAFDLSRFTRNEERCTLTPAGAVKAWAGKWISGRYAQPDDPKQGFFERYLTPYPDALEIPAEIGPRACLPHHNEIAVDKRCKGSVPDGHRLYRTVAQFNGQFDARSAAAARHIASVYARWQAAGHA